MSRILVRSGKDPFTSVSAAETYARDTMNTNVGNYLFSQSMFRALMGPDNQVESDFSGPEKTPATAQFVSQVNERFDAFVVPLANAFRPEFIHRLDNLSTFVEGLTIPVVVAGVGAQTSLSLNAGDLDHIGASVKRFTAAVLDRSESIGVRGQFTADYLRNLGFPSSSIDIIGCPSLRLNGPGFRLGAHDGVLPRRSKIAVNVTPGVEGIEKVCERMLGSQHDVFYVGQDKPDLRLILWGEESISPRHTALPTYLDHPWYQSDRVRFPLDVSTWVDYLRSFDFAVGSRFHGNVAATLADTPAMLLVHDSRTLELADYHKLPHRRAVEVSDRTTVEELYRDYDPAEFNKAYDHRFQDFVGFLDRNALPHCYASDDPGSSFDNALQLADLPEIVTLRGSGGGPSASSRVQLLRKLRNVRRLTWLRPLGRLRRYRGFRWLN